MADQPWHELPPEVVEVLRPALDDVAHEMMEAVATIPAYARPLEGPFGEGLRIGVQEALKHLLAEIEASGHVDRLDVYRALGQGEMRSGRSLESLLSAYRIGARVAWRRFAALGVEAGLEPDTLYLLAESIFAYIDVLSAESAEGYALEQSAAAGEAQLRRRRLVRMLMRETPAEPDAVERAARRRRVGAAAQPGGDGDQRPEPGEPRAPRPAARGRSARRSASSCARSCSDPDGPGSAQRSSRRSPASGPARDWARPLTGPRRERASRARRPRSSWWRATAS